MQAICQISLPALSNNYDFLKRKVYPAIVIPVVKANAYGHGAETVSRHLFDNHGVKLFAVATLEEAQELTRKIPSISVLIFSRVFATELSELPENAILSIGSIEDAQSLIQSGKPTIKVHLNINTGMNRLGLSLSEALDLVKKASNLNILGVYSHFSSSDTLSKAQYNSQKRAFKAVSDKMKARGYTGLFHIANSASSLAMDAPTYDAIRLGIALYGYDTTPEQLAKNQLHPAMIIEAPLVRIARVKAGEPVSYGEQWCPAVETHIGTIRFGYADGYNRALGNQGRVSHGGKSYPVVGTITMDHIMIDLGQDTFPPSTYFTIMGGEHLDTQISTISKTLNTIPYEICCGISSRVKRNYQN